MRSLLAGLVLCVLALSVVSGPVRAQDAELPVFRLLMKGQKFDPPTLTVPPGVKFILMVHNGDDSPVEFESGPLNVEKVISAGRDATVRLGPLKPGTYAFTDDFHQAAKGVLTVSEK